MNAGKRNRTYEHWDPHGIVSKLLRHPKRQQARDLTMHGLASEAHKMKLRPSQRDRAPPPRPILTQRFCLHGLLCRSLARANHHCLVDGAGV
jgi:hypothetical protein